MPKVRKKVPPATEAEVLVECRRRCCVCFGLKRDEGIKKGQIAHLDKDPSNNARENLVFLCFDHHDEYDSATSQSKGLIRLEIEKFREELHGKYSNWSAGINRDHLLNFLAFTADDDALADAAVKAAGRTVFYGKELALQILTSDSFSSIDGDLYVPYLVTLDYYSSWGLLTFTAEERDCEEEGIPAMFIAIDRKPICDVLAGKIRAKDRN